jgi:hypothetical protein
MALPYTFRRDKIGEIPRPPFREAYPIDELFCSFSGADIQCFIFGDQLALTNDSNWVDSSPNLTQDEKEFVKVGISKSRDQRLVTVLGELQTITISSARSFGPVRRLGEIEPVCYKGGARTIAGTMVFAVMNKDVFAQMYQGLADGMSENITKGPDFVDSMPPFHILIRGYNEYGASASALLIDAKITNFGTTFSVDDMFTESTYNYVAKHYIPFVSDWKQEIQTYETKIKETSAKPISELPSESSNPFFGFNDLTGSPSTIEYGSSVDYDRALELSKKNAGLPLGVNRRKYGNPRGPNVGFTGRDLIFPEL